MSKKKTEEQNSKSNSVKEKKASVLFYNPVLDRLIDQVLYREYSYMKKVLKQSGLEASLAYLANRQADKHPGRTQAKRKTAELGRG